MDPKDKNTDSAEKMSSDDGNFPAPKQSSPDLNQIFEEKDNILEDVRSNAQFARKWYAAYCRWLRDAVEMMPGLEKKDKQRALFWAGQIINAMSPANYFWTNPSAVQKFLESRGESLRKGYNNWFEDVQRGDGLVQMVDDREFKIGVNIATTPGFVIFRNELMELIQYSPATPGSYAVPIVLIPPWINKFYIFDLSEQTSLVRYFLDQGFTLFMISWKNPTQEMRHVTFDDYLLQGVLKAIDVARTICKVKQVHAAGYCIGGTVLAALMAWLNRASGPKRPLPVIDWTLFSTLVDFAEPGDLGVLITSQTVEAMEDQMKKDGYLDKKYLSLAFRLLRSDSLIWRNFVFNYLYGGTPPKSDMLYWNSDGTRLPETMCSFYLRELYLNNHLAKKDGVRLGGRPIDLGCIDQPLYAVGAQQDHISPWQSAFRTCALVKGPVKFVLSSEGHITGIVNPPTDLSRKKYWVGEAGGVSDPDRWLSGQREQRGSWWADWAAWLSPRSSPMVKSPSPGSRKYPPLEKAPGSYVLEP